MYSLALLNAAHRGLVKGHALLVRVNFPDGRVIDGVIVGIGSRVGVIDEDGRLHEDTRAEWISHGAVVDRTTK
jgi:hypothetical protein